MSATENRIVRIVAWSFIVVILYGTISLMLLAFSMIEINRGVAHKDFVLKTYQRYLYHKGWRDVYQSRRERMEFDRDLLYKPKQGRFAFNNLEYRTFVTYGPYGRVSGNVIDNDRPGIAVLGDSHAMGYGAQDSETFAARLEKRLDRHVYNLAVSSYGTYRELLSLQKSGLLQKIDTIVIQYCENDLDENRAKLADRSPSSPEKFDVMFGSTKRDVFADFFSKLNLWLEGTFTLPVHSAVALFTPYDKSYDFGPHYLAMKKVFSLFPWIENKRVIVIYSNRYGRKYRNYAEVTRGETNPNLRFVDLQFGVEYYFDVDDHPNVRGHAKIAEILGGIIH
ncbi:MAG: SGNH/GDSL hydrolase family protein [Chlorobiaceae bacterium]|nr:SGNH/GDSL hydrolase family protein [Chlorobiaceae bacterium]